MDEAELRAQLEQHHAASYGWALSCCAGTPELSEDVLQTAYLKILQGRARYNGRATFKTWLFAVIRMTAADERRRQWLRHFRLSGYERDRGSRVQLPERGDRLDQSAKLGVFQQALARLAKRQQEVVHLVFYQNLSLPEASEIMGVSLGSARTHYERGKRNLRAWLEKSEHFDEYRKDREQTETTLW
ncbi:MAG TPA: RNA polymerase sigma factor [Candidatus Binatia bacterium]|nr:RNA polymerase sigma factor [Candidatus Binatia bacterium]